MAGHSQFKNIQHRKERQDKKRAKLFSRIIREIISAVNSGSDDPDTNPRLRHAITKAKAANLPKDKIEKAIHQGKNRTNSDNFVPLRYEGIYKENYYFIVETLTDNKNRTVSEIRTIFSKHNVKLTNTGGVIFHFNKVGIIHYPSSIGTGDKVLEQAMEADIIDMIFEEEDEEWTVFTEVDKLNDTVETLNQIFNIQATESHLGWKSNNQTLITNQLEKEEVTNFLNHLENQQDIEYIFSNIKI